MNLWRLLFYAYSILTCLVYLFLYLFDASELSGYPLVAFILNLIIYFKYCSCRDKELFRNWLNPSYILLLGLIIVNLQTLLNVLFGYESINYYLGRFASGKNAGDIYLLSLLSVTCYLIGNSINISKPEITRYKNTPILASPWKLIIISFFIWFILAIDINSFILGTHYTNSGAFDRLDDGSGFPETMLNATLTIYAVLCSLNARRQFMPPNFFRCYSPLFWSIISVYIVLRLFSGDRGPVIYNILMLTYCFYIVYKPQIRLIFFIGMVILAALGVTLLGVARNNVEQSFSEKYVSAYTEFGETHKISLSPLTQELANSVNCNFIAYNSIQEGDTDYTFGKYTFFGVASSIPASGTLYSKLFDINLRNYYSSEFITAYAMGPNYRFGLGTTTFAELYLDFGIIGLIIGFILLGLLFHRIDLIILHPLAYKPLWVIFSVVMAMYSIYIPRSSIGTSISKAIYALIIFSLVNLFINRFHLKLSK